MYYESETGGRCCVCAGQTVRVHSRDGSTYLREITSWPPPSKYDVISEILRQSMRIYARNNPAKFHPAPI